MLFLTSFLLLIGFLQPGKPAPLLLRSQIDARLLDKVQQLEDDYQVKLVFDQKDFPRQQQGSYEIKGQDASLQAINKYLPQFLQEWRLYPRTLVTHTNLKYIVFGTGFQLAQEQRKRNAIPDYYHDAMYYDVGLSLTGELQKKYLLEIIHHEFFHFIDYKDDGEVYDDKVWKKLNRPEFRYGRGGISVQSDSSQGTVTDKIPGFISRYATSGVEEDKAEIFRCMMVNLLELEARAEKDIILSNKIARMKTLLNAFCPEMNEPYWQRLREMQRPRLTMPPYQDQWAKDHPSITLTQPMMTAVMSNNNSINYHSSGRSGGRVTLYDLSRQGYGSVLEYCRPGR